MEYLGPGLERLFGKKPQFSIAVDIEKDAVPGKFGALEWLNLDKTRKIEISQGSIDTFPRTWIKTIRLIALDPNDQEFSRVELLCISEIIRPQNKREYSVSFDALVQNNAKIPSLGQVVYSSRDDGKMQPIHRYKIPMKHGNQTQWSDEAYGKRARDSYTSQGIRFQTKLPPYLDIPKTIQQFMHQIKERNLMQARLVPYEPTESQKKAIEARIKERQESAKEEEAQRQAAQAKFQNRTEVVLFQRAMTAIEQLLPSGQEKRKVAILADQIESVKEKLKTLRCGIIIGEQSENGHHSTTITLRVDRVQEKAVRAILEAANVHVPDDQEKNFARHEFFRTMMRRGHITQQDYLYEAGISEYVLLRCRHGKAEDFGRMQLAFPPPNNTPLNNNLRCIL